MEAWRKKNLLSHGGFLQDFMSDQIAHSNMGHFQQLGQTTSIRPFPDTRAPEENPLHPPVLLLRVHSLKRAVGCAPCLLLHGSLRRIPHRTRPRHPHALRRQKLRHRRPQAAHRRRHVQSHQNTLSLPPSLPATQNSQTLRKPRKRKPTNNSRKAAISRSWGRRGIEEMKNQVRVSVLEIGDGETTGARATFSWKLEQARRTCTSALGRLAAAGPSNSTSWRILCGCLIFCFHTERVLAGVFFRRRGGRSRESAPPPRVACSTLGKLSVWGRLFFVFTYLYF